MDDTVETLAAAAVVHGGKGEADGSLLEFIRRITLEGYEIRGLAPVPKNDRKHGTVRAVRDLYDNAIYPIGQSLGKDSTSCSLDPGALIRASVVLRRALDSQADLIIVNRFGLLEAEGDGFCAEMLELMSRGLPLLTVVSRTNLNAWRNFTGGTAIELPPDADMMMQWFKGLNRATPATVPVDAGSAPHIP